MKAFLGGILATVLAGVILFYCQKYYDKYSDENKYVVELNNKNDEVSLSSDDLDKLKAALKERGGLADLKIRVYELKNIGNNEISDKSFSTPIDNIFGFGNISPPNNVDKNVEFKFDKKYLTINYKIFPINSSHKFWIANSTMSFLPLEFSPDNPGIKLAEKPQIDDGGDYIFIGGIIAVISVLVGMIIGFCILFSELKSRGVNVEDELKKEKVTR